MIAVDTNLLVYAHREDSDFHEDALRVFTELTDSGSPWAIPWPCIHEFLAIITHPRIYRPPTPMAIALSAASTWINAPSCRMLAEGPEYWETLQNTIKLAKVNGPAIHDARIAALCAHHGVQELWTADRDFSRYGALRCRNPMT